MDLSVQQILRDNKVKGIFHTHVSMGKNPGKYNFNRQDLEKFWNLYMKELSESAISLSSSSSSSSDSISEFNFGVAEKPQHYLPVLVDVDIKIKEDDSQVDIEIDSDTGEEILHTEKHVKEIRDIYQSVLRDIVENCTDQTLICILLEKPLYRTDSGGVSYMKHGFHLHFPYCFLSKVDQEIHLIPRVKQIVTDMKIFSDIGIEDSGKAIDDSSCKAQWLLYGSSKDEGLDPYKVSKVFNSEGDEISLEDAFSKYLLYDQNEKLIKLKGKVKYFLPRILSIIPYGREPCDVRGGLSCPSKEKMIERALKSRSETKFKNVSVIEALEVARQLVPMLSVERAEDRNEWMIVGWVLYNIGEGCHEALDLWCDFSQKCEEKYDEAVCVYQWERMIKKEYTLGTLRHFAGIDSPEQYKNFKKTQAIKYVHESLNGSHNDVAKVLCAEYGDGVICASATNKIWYHFVDNKWELDEEGMFLRSKISGEIVEKFTVIGKDLLTQLSKCNDKGEEAMVNARLKQVQKMISSLKSSPYKTNVLKECAEVFFDKRFAEKLDTNPALFPFKNGIYDLNANIFRPGRPEDFISKTAPIDYKEFDYDDQEVQDVFDYLETVFPDKSVKRYFLDMASSVFYGGNQNKHVYFWTGEGDNSKSVLQSIFEKMLGKLAIKFNTSVVTGKKAQSGTANPELARSAGGVRWAVLEEPNSDETINIGILKNLSGNDTYLARDLFEKGREAKEITPLYKLIFITNKLPKLKHSDKAVWNRIRVIPFESTFCRSDDPAPETYEEQLKQKRFPMDTEFPKKIPGMLQPFAWILLKHRLTIKESFEPEKVRMATAMYRRENDIYRQFVEESIVQEKGKVLTLVELYAQFKEWFKEGLPGHQIPVKGIVEEYFVKTWGEPEKGKRWKGYRIKTLQDDLDSGDAVELDDGDFVEYDAKSSGSGNSGKDEEKTRKRFLPPM